MNIAETPSPIHILLADDDGDERHFFDKALQSLLFNAEFVALEDGEQLMDYLLHNCTDLPDVLFLDYNMPCKNGFECLAEIKSHPLLKALPVIMYSTYLHADVADILYDGGAHFYIRKTSLVDLKKLLHHVLTLLAENKFTRPTRDNFILSPIEA